MLRVQDNVLVVELDDDGLIPDDDVRYLFLLLPNWHISSMIDTIGDAYDYLGRSGE